jgi:hypothetical protein
VAAGRLGEQLDQIGLTHPVVHPHVEQPVVHLGVGRRQQIAAEQRRVRNRHHVRDLERDAVELHLHQVSAPR